MQQLSAGFFIFQLIVARRLDVTAWFVLHQKMRWPAGRFQRFSRRKFPAGESIETELAWRGKFFFERIRKDDLLGEFGDVH